MAHVERPVANARARGDRLVAYVALLSLTETAIALGELERATQYYLPDEVRRAVAAAREAPGPAYEDMFDAGSPVGLNDAAALAVA